MPRIDAQRMVREFGGPSQLQRRLVKDGHDISLKAVERWISRGRIPGDWLVIMSVYAVNDGRHIHLHDYVLSDEDTSCNSSEEDYLD